MFTTFLAVISLSCVVSLVATMQSDVYWRIVRRLNPQHAADISERRQQIFYFGLAAGIWAAYRIWGK